MYDKLLEGLDLSIDFNPFHIDKFPISFDRYK